MYIFTLCSLAINEQCLIQAAGQSTCVTSVQLAPLASWCCVVAATPKTVVCSDICLTFFNFF